MKFLVGLLFLVSCTQSKIRFSIVPTHFYLTNQDTIDPLLRIVYDECRPAQDILVNIKFDYFPLELLRTNPGEAGATAIFPDLTMININIYQYAYMSPKEQQTLILHELGHMIGMPHQGDSSSVMYMENHNRADFIKFKQELKIYCKSLVDVPRGMSDN